MHNCAIVFDFGHSSVYLWAFILSDLLFGTQSTRTRTLIVPVHCFLCVRLTKYEWIMIAVVADCMANIKSYLPSVVSLFLHLFIYKCAFIIELQVQWEIRCEATV